jgi:hypothetical protein
MRTARPAGLTEILLQSTPTSVPPHMNVTRRGSGNERARRRVRGWAEVLIDLKSKVVKLTTIRHGDNNNIMTKVVEVSL